MNKNNEFKEVINMAQNNGKIEDFYNIMNDYFCELEKYHPQIYVNLTKNTNYLQSFSHYYI